MSHELKTTPDELKDRTPSSQFVKWMVYFEELDNKKMNDHDSTVWHLAQVAEELAGLPYRVWGKEIPKSLRGVEKFLLKFTTEKEFLKNKKKSERRRKKQDSALAFNVFSAFMGIDPATMQVKKRMATGVPEVVDPELANLTPVYPPDSSQNGPSFPVSPPQGVRTPPTGQNKKTGPKRKNVSIRGVVQ